MFWSENKKVGIPQHSSVLPYTSGVQWVYISRTCFPDAFTTKIIQKSHRFGKIKLKKPISLKDNAMETSWKNISDLTINLSHIMRKPAMWFLNRSDTNRAVQAQKMVRNWKFEFRKKRICTIGVAKTKALISFPVTAKLIYVFVFE